jgi:hypothetical protein
MKPVSAKPETVSTNERNDRKAQLKEILAMSQQLLQNTEACHKDIQGIRSGIARLETTEGFIQLLTEQQKSNDSKGRG